MYTSWSGCTTTSAIFHMVRTALMKLTAKEDREVLDICSTFGKTDATPKEIGKAGVKLFVTKYGKYCDSF